MLVLDPHHFILDSGQTEFSGERIKELKVALKNLNKICIALREKICFDKEAWRKIELMYIRPLLQNANDQELNVAFEALRDHLEFKRFSEKVIGRTWGVWSLFGNIKTPQDMEHADHLARAALFCARKDLPVYIFVREVERRNIKTHRVDHSLLIERLRWRIYISEQGLAGAVAVPCITDIKNIKYPWTARYDVGLPPSGTYAFVPKTDWELKKTSVFKVTKSKPAYIDNQSSAWARPNTPGAPYHWDVYVCKEWKVKCGLDQINVCRSDVPASQGESGEIHHVPDEKKAAYKK